MSHEHRFVNVDVWPFCRGCGLTAAQIAVTALPRRPMGADSPEPVSEHTAPHSEGQVN